MRVSFDPGGTTGIAVRRDDGEIAVYETTNPKAVIDWIRPLAKDNLRHDVVVEDFISGARATHDARETQRLVGMIIGACTALGVPCRVQPNQMREPCLSKAKEIIRELHPDESVSPHKRDALAHLLAWEERRGK